MIVEFEGSLLNPKLFAILFANIPLLVEIYCERICWTAVWFLSILSKLSFPNTVNKLGVSVWSERLAPTDGLLTIGGRPNDFRNVLFPIPDSWSICGVPIAPAERITSFCAVMVNVELFPVEAVKRTVVNIGPAVVAFWRSRVTVMLNRTTRLGRALAAAR